MTRSPDEGPKPSRDSIPIALQGVEAGYSGRGILPALDLRIAPGETWALIGRNGAGKSTLLRTILGLQPSVAGTVVRDEAERVSYVPQRGDYDLSIPARVIDVVRSGADCGWSFLRPTYLRQRAAIIDKALADTLTAPLARQQFNELSEGQKQRVLIAKALASEPTLVVLDEPTSAMDPIAERGVFELIDRLRRERNLAILIASHTMSFVPMYATHAILVDADDRLVLSGTVDEVLRSDELHERYGFIVRALAEDETRTRDL